MDQSTITRKCPSKCKYTELKKSVSAPNLLNPGVAGWSCPCSSVWLSCRFLMFPIASSGILTLALGFLGAQLSRATGSHMEVFGAAVLFQLSHAREKLWVSAFTKLKVRAKIPPLMLAACFSSQKLCLSEGAYWIEYRVISNLGAVTFMLFLIHIVRINWWHHSLQLPLCSAEYPVRVWISFTAPVSWQKAAPNGLDWNRMPVKSKRKKWYQTKLCVSQSGEHAKWDQDAIFLSYHHI